MAKKLQAFQAEFDSMEKAIASIAQDFLPSAKSVSDMENLFEPAAAEIGARIYKLKSGGTAGDTLDDFKNDAEIKVQLKLVADLLRNVVPQLAKLKKCKQQAQGVVKQQAGLAKDLKDEIKDRDRKKIVVDSQSLPDLKKLAVKVNAIVSQRDWRVIDEAVIRRDETLNASHFQAYSDRLIKEAIAASKAGPAPKQPMEREEAKAIFVQQHVSSQLAKAGKLFDSVKRLCDAAVKEAAVPNLVAVKDALTKATAAHDEIAKMVATFQEATKEMGSNSPDSKEKAIRSKIKQIEDKLADAATAIADAKKAVNVALRPKPLPKVPSKK
jgi:hypothetical protein